MQMKIESIELKQQKIANSHYTIENQIYVPKQKLV
jgi:hypothetical protein